MICPHCESDNRDTAKFCNDCGLPLGGKIAEMTVSLSDDTCAAEVSPECCSEPIAKPHVGNIPDILIPGVNAKDDSSPFDFSEISFQEEQDNPVTASDSDQEQDSVMDYAPVSPHKDSSPDKTADFSGLDECLVDSSYTPPQSSWKTGGTMEMPRIGDDMLVQSKEFKAPQKTKEKSKIARVFGILLILLMVFGASAAGFTYYLELWGGKILPDVVGLTQTDATFVLEEKGFDVTVMSVKSDETEGLVLLMDPSAGARQELGSEVIIHVSVSRTVSEVVGMQRDEAAALLKEDGFENVTFVTEKSDEQEGLVLSVSPEGGEKAQSDTEIIVTISTPFVVPDITDMTYDEAVAAIEDEGLEAKSVYVYDDSVEEGSILGTDIDAGSKVTSDTTVYIQIAKSRGAELVSATQSYLSSRSQITLAGVDYEIRSVDGISYEGDNTTVFTVTVAAVTTLDGETVYGSQKQKTAAVVWNDSNEIVSIT